jgi:TonB family protein
MALRLERKYDQRFSSGSSGPSIAIGVPSFIFEEAEGSKRILYWAVAAAALLHLGLFFVTFPSFRREPQVVATAQKVYVIQSVRFQQPKPAQAEPMRKKRAKKVPIPDPTPDLPEPIRTADVEVPQLDITQIGDIDVAFIPDAPPGAGIGIPSAMPLGGNVRPPVKIHAPQPGYTEEARQARVQGVVILQAIIDAAGRVTNLKVLKGLPHGLAEAALETVRTWQFEPATLEGEAVPVYYNFTVNFSLQ